MSSEHAAHALDRAAPAIQAEDLSKCYQLYERPADRLKQMLFRGRRRYYREFWALRNVSFRIRRGEVLGVVGRNGAGKSTLLQLICGTLQPSSGRIAVSGRIAALLELGAGFNPEFTGRENVFMSAAIMGLEHKETEARLAEIFAFAGIGAFVDQPVKTYSSGMFVRLAFAVATSVDPDILVVDEALSVGDGEFSRKSFDRILALKDAGKTILFCSHALYQVEALCNTAIWLDQGEVKAIGATADVIVAYSAFLESLRAGAAAPAAAPEGAPIGPSAAPPARIVSVELTSTGTRNGDGVIAASRRDDVIVTVRFVADRALPVPSVGVVFSDAQGRNICSAGSHIDGVLLERDAEGRGGVRVTFPQLPLLKGDYWLNAYLLCERGIHVYDYANGVARLTVTQDCLEQGVVSLPRKWRTEL